MKDQPNGCARCGHAPANFAWLVPGAMGVWRVCRGCHAALLASASDADTRKLNDPRAEK